MRESSTPTTRLSQRTKTLSLAQLEGLLNNVVRFVECPITDEGILRRAWHGRFPEEYTKAVDVLVKYGGGRGVQTSNTLAIGVDSGGKTYSVMLRINEHRYGIGEQHGFLRVLPELKADMGVRKLRCANPVDDSSWSVRDYTVSMDEEYLSKHMGAQAEDFMVWVKNTAQLYDELITAKLTLSHLFDMSKTAGQIKRMVPELMQYLPAAQRLAFEDQKRSSTVPFEWAPYPKERIEVMLTAINKGHLLEGMSKPNQSCWSVDNLDALTWSRYAKWTD